MLIVEDSYAAIVLPSRATCKVHMAEEWLELLANGGHIASCQLGLVEAEDARVVVLQKALQSVALQHEFESIDIPVPNPHSIFIINAAHYRLLRRS